ncbi:MAG: indole-3-glycerol phosphate synthase TrpC [Candidatus Aureabacteria bacterium]|nr:indole-3-glycerol phosphate synthase TrpC [Candidatus Auribacterota bacterium]
MILEEILKYKEQEIKERKKKFPLEALKDKCEMAPLTRPFAAAINRDDFISVIAESKKASPSKGNIVDSYDPVFIISQYEEGGANAISVLTDERYFKGSIDDLVNIKANTKLPVLRKDFIIDAYQLYESKAAGADAVLLIAKAISGDKIKEMLEISFGLYLDVVVEVHDEEELDGVVGISGIKIIGINNRNLDDFKVDIGTSEKLLPKIPKGIIKISESGFFSKSDVARIVNAGADAVLVGEALMKAKDKKEKIKELKIAKHKNERGSFGAA